MTKPKNLTELMDLDSDVEPMSPKEDFELIMSQYREKLQNVRPRIIGDDEDTEFIRIILDKAIDDITDNLTRLKRDL